MSSQPSSIDPAFAAYGDRKTNSQHGLAHVMSPWVLVAVFTALIALTAITVAVTRFDLGNLNLFVALAIATAKAILVAIYFMHLRYDSPFHSLILGTALLFLALFLWLTLLDATHYQTDIRNFRDAAAATAAP